MPDYSTRRRRRLFWEKAACAALTGLLSGPVPPQTDKDWAAAQFADLMLREWEKRWAVAPSTAAPDLSRQAAPVDPAQANAAPSEFAKAIIKAAGGSYCQNCSMWPVEKQGDLCTVCTWRSKGGPDA